MGLREYLFGTNGGQNETEAAENTARIQRELREQAERRGTTERTERFIGTVGGVESVAGAWREGFGEGLSEGRGNVDSAFFGTLKKILATVPWFIWLGVALGIFFWLGGFAMLAKKSKGVLARG